MTDETPEPEVETEESPPVEDKRLWERLQEAIQAILVEDDATEENDNPDATWIVSNFWLTVECVSISGEKFIQHLYPPLEGWWTHLGLVDAAKDAIKKYRAEGYEAYQHDDDEDDDDDTSHA